MGVAVDDPNDLVVVEEDGSVRAPGRVADRRLRERAGRYRLVADTIGFIMLRAERSQEELDKHARVLMSGEIVSRMTVLEVLNMIASASWRGEMHVYGSDHHRVMAIDGGAVKFARSDDPDDRLGQVLYQNGVVSKQQLDEVLSAVDRERRLGVLLVERGLLTEEQLFVQLRKQVEQIFFAALLTGEGTYVFLKPDESEAPPVHPVHLPVQALLMEGVQRIDEMALFRQRIPGSDFIPEIVPRSSAQSLDENAQLVLAYCDGSRTIEVVARESGLGEFLTTKTLYGLMQQNLIVLKKNKGDGGSAVRRLVEEFNEVLRDVFVKVGEHGGQEHTKATVEAWIQGSGYVPIFGEEVNADGTVDADSVVMAMEAVQIDNPMEGLLQAFHELSAFALFAATTALPRDQELALSREVTARLKRIRL
jgi:hypothetical protein